MKSTALVFAIAAASLGFSTTTLARDSDWRGDGQVLRRTQSSAPRHLEERNQNQYEGRRDHRLERRHDRRDDRRDDRFDDRFEQRFERGAMLHNNRHEYYNARRPEFRRGHYMPRQFRNRQYDLTDYRAHRLNPPPRGHQWVRVGSDYVLIAIATGLIANLVFNY